MGVGPVFGVILLIACVVLVLIWNSQIDRLSDIARTQMTTVRELNELAGAVGQELGTVSWSSLEAPISMPTSHKSASNPRMKVLVKSRLEALASTWAAWGSAQENRTLGYRLRERALSVGRRAFVLGRARIRQGEVVIEQNVGDARFLISAKSRVELMSSTKKTILWLQIAAISCGLLGAGLTIADLVGVI